MFVFALWNGTVCYIHLWVLPSVNSSNVQLCSLLYDWDVGNGSKIVFPEVSFIPVKLHQNSLVWHGCCPKITLVTQRFNSNILTQVRKSLQQLIPSVERAIGRMMLCAIHAKNRVILTKLYSINNISVYNYACSGYAVTCFFHSELQWKGKMRSGTSSAALAEGILLRGAAAGTTFLWLLGKLPLKLLWHHLLEMYSASSTEIVCKKSLWIRGAVCNLF